ncbi:MAG: zinc finger domain-containing protein [Sulfolobales archaeon]
MSGVIVVATLSTRLPRPALVDEISPPICSSCKRIIPPYEKAVSFTCPNCGKYTIWRCKKCRNAAISYRCPVCGFEGP